VKPRRWIGPEAASLCEVTGEADPIVAIEQLARELIDVVGFNEPPFDPAILASFRDVREIRRVTMAGAARILPHDGALVIEVNGDHSLGKQNFSADHEVIHTLIPTYGGQRVDDAETGTFASGFEEELLCDIGAAALLLDQRWLRGFAYEAGPSITTLLNLAMLFGASLQATARQITQLNLWPCAFVFWEEGFRKAERIPNGQTIIPGLEVFGGPQPKLRVACVYVTDSFGVYVPHNKSAGAESLVTACSEDDPLTFGMEKFDFGGGPINLYCQNYHCPYRKGAAIRRRVISLLVPAPLRDGLDCPVVTHRLEVP
jgi:hypothetical protein